MTNSTKPTAENGKTGTITLTATNNSGAYIAEQGASWGNLAAPKKAKGSGAAGETEPDKDAPKSTFVPADEAVRTALRGEPMRKLASACHERGYRIGQVVVRLDVDGDARPDLASYEELQAAFGAAMSDRD